jgi:predicted SAM-dependent methyltransferase
MKLNIACGFKKLNGFINIDSDAGVMPDIVRNIERGLPFSDNTVDYILSEHTLEHISPDLIHFVMYEFWRVLKSGCQLKIIVPIGKGLTNSPEHKSFWDYKSWIFFTDWNYRLPYKFKLIENKVVGEDITEELHFILEVVK